jgi:hypothetical protein
VAKERVGALDSGPTFKRAADQFLKECAVITEGEGFRMRISTDALDSEIEPAMDWIGSLIGAAVDKRIAAFEKQERVNPLLAEHFRENFALEFALAEARRHRRNTGRLPKGKEYDPLYSFLIPTQRIHAA